jgi:hypothetical protein
MAKLDPEFLAHLEWLGFVRPTGLVVSAPALVRAGAILNRRDTEGQRLLRACVVDRTIDPKEGPVPYLPDFRVFAEAVLGWSFSPKGYAGLADNPIPSELEVPLPDYGETLRPDFAVRELEPKDGASPWQLLVRVLDPGDDLDRVVRQGGHLEASAHGRMERLLRQTGVPAGLVFNGRAIRLVSAPRGESSGWVDFCVADMVQSPGRPISTALRLLLCEQRLLSLPRAQRLPALLEDSRKFQNEVSERLAQQVLHALYELLRGFQAAHYASKGELLRQSLAEKPDEVYRALLTVILRLVFLLYAEERDILPEDETFLRYYSLAGLYDRLREDSALFPDTMDQRFGAWPQLVVLFRMIHDGANSDAMRLPRRHGVLFDPDRFEFLEGRPIGSTRQVQERIESPLVPDGTIFRALEKLLVLNGERISYRALDVEQIGSVYETMMGFRLETATGHSIAIKAPKTQGAPTTVDLDALLREPASRRDKWLRDHADRKLVGAVLSAVLAATSLEDLYAALLPVIDSAATPDLVPKGAMVLQPSEERRRSGSHYTPRALTSPIVRSTLEPILVLLRGASGQAPRPAQILGIKVCDPAMGSGAFLVETCRQLGDALVDAWHAHGEVPAIPPDEDELVLARRLVAQRCLYGVDRNSVAVDLAKVSLWLVTMAKDHALTFVDHALRHGDSLVGLSREQIEGFHWKSTEPRFRVGFETMKVREHVARISTIRQQISAADQATADRDLRELWIAAESELDIVRLYGDLVLAAFFEGDTIGDREANRSEYASSVIAGTADQYAGRLEKWRQAPKPLIPFHWEIEFPEVFYTQNPGFDAMVGNPPFAGVVQLAKAMGERYPEFLRECWTNVSGQTDLAAFFFRRSFDVLRNGGCLGLLATNTIAQGDTRESGLSVICESGGEIYQVTKRIRWPGRASVIVSRVHICKGHPAVPILLSGRRVERISAFLFHAGGDRNPRALENQPCVAGKGIVPWGMGFVFDDEVTEGPSLKEMNAALAVNPSCGERIRRFVGGSDLNTLPDLTPNRFIIDLDGLEEEAAKHWPELFAILERYVKPVRLALPETAANRRLRERWWHFSQGRAIREAMSGLERVLVCSQTSKWRAFCFIDGSWIFDQKVIAFARSENGFFAVMQSRLHEIWSDFFGSTMKDDPVYTPPSCFDTFPFPLDWQASAALGHAGTQYYEYRHNLMISRKEGLTATYNHFHSPEERDIEILRLRDLRTDMDRAVLEAYGWSDIPTPCDFILDYEVNDEEWGDKKKPYRYRWPDEIRDEVLARLLELNVERVREDAISGAAATKTQGKRMRAKQVRKPSNTKDMFL